jgi:ketosteroid isomerase-like protein
MDPLLTTNLAFYQAIIDKRVADICAHYVQSPQTYVFVEGPRYATLGYDHIAKGWHDFCASPLTLEKIEWVEGPLAEVAGSMGWLAGQIVLTVQLRQQVFSVRFRATFVFRQEPDGQWRISHEHVSGPLEDPYGIGDWLKK